MNLHCDFIFLCKVERSRWGHDLDAQNRNLICAQERFKPAEPFLDHAIRTELTTPTPGTS
jgi:hypothetical protein